MIHGLRVFGGNGMLLNVCREHNVEQVLSPALASLMSAVAEIMRAARPSRFSQAHAHQDRRNQVMSDGDSDRKERFLYHLSTHHLSLLLP